MRQRRFWWCVLGVLLGLGSVLILWRPTRNAAPANAIPAGLPVQSELTQTAASAAVPASVLANNREAVALATGHETLFARRVSNTPANLSELLHNEQAVLLRNALIDTTRPLALNIPARFRAPSNTATYIVQVSGVTTDAFRELLRSTGARIVSYIPNNAWLVRVAPERVSALRGSPLTRAVLPFEPFYKLDERLFDGRFTQYRVLGFPGEETTLTQALRAAGARVMNEERSALGTIFTIESAGTELSALAGIDALQIIEPKGVRVAANDLVRVALGVSVDTTTTTNYLDLTGSNVLVNVNDTGFDIQHPDLTPRITVDSNGTALDPDGHGTFVAGVIASSGANSSNLVAAGSPAGSNHRGMAPAAKIFGVHAIGSDDQSDASLQELAAATNAPISNNSWNYAGAFGYDLAAASFDAAARDALPAKTGSQPLLFVFPAGNSGFGNNNGLGGVPGSIASPGTSKNSITVGASELPRNISNEVVLATINGTNSTSVTNQPWLALTDSSDQVAAPSGRGNVGAGIEGPRGRFKPDVVAPGVFTVSTRSDDWDTSASYNPTNFTVNRLRFHIPAGEFARDSIFIQNNAVRLIIQLLPNSLTPLPFPDLPIFVRQADRPTTTAFDAMKTNLVSLPPDAPLDPVGETWFYSVLNPYTNDISVDVRTIIATTNDLGNYFQVLSNLNETLDPAHLYRYESGTSVAAPAVSGMLALMEEFFEQRLQPSYSPSSRPSPALLKALVINGARSLGPNYNLSPVANITHEGWGIANLTNSLPPAISNVFKQAGADTPFVFYDQSPTNALATGQSRTFKVSLMTDEARIQPLRFTLVWTDPPGNPVAGPKLVNDLDLIVTNLTTGEIYSGNDMPDGQDFTQPTPTNGTPIPDVINNVENVFLRTPGSNYAVTVVGRRVNVNAVTAQTNAIAQDYALVISSGDGGSVTNAFRVTDNNQVAFGTQPLVTIVQSNGVPLLNQHVGANHPLITGRSGTTNQWHFFIYTNATTFTNVAFVTFLPATLSVPRIGVRESDEDNATRIEADLDLYVSTDGTLLQLNPAALAAARKSLNRGGTESVVLINALPDQVFFIGVKAEDQMAADFGFLGISSEEPFSILDAQGNQHVRGLSLPAAIPDGDPTLPGGLNVFAIAVYPMEVRKVVVTNVLTHENMGDLLGNLSHGQQFAVLNNHRPLALGGGLPQLFIYDDSGEATILGAIHSDGPGSLRDFVGEQAAGVWMLSMVDNSFANTGHVDLLTLRLERVIDDAFLTSDILPQQFFFDSINVPPEATNLTVTIGNNTAPVELYIRKGAFPTRTLYDKFRLINPPGGSLSVTLFDLPPLTAGRYYIGIFNPNATVQRVTIAKTLGLGVSPASRGNFLNPGGAPLLDDAVSRSFLTITNDEKIARAEVGVIIEHPRVADLALTLISPSGERILLAENRGGLTTAGYGKSQFITNVVSTDSLQGPQATTNVIQAGANAGSIRVNYNFETIPDMMQIFYQGAKIFDTGLANGTNSFSVNFGPGASTDISIVMNPTNNANPGTVWSYTATVISGSGLHAVFTENTNLNPVPIKFAIPPFAPGGAAQLITFASGFETNPGAYTAGQLFDGWAVETNQVSVVNDPVLANTGTNLLALADGRISRTLPTVAGRTYQLSYAYRGPGIVSWWRGEGNYVDSVAGHNGTQQNVGFAPGEVGQAFAVRNAGQVFPGPRIAIQDSADFMLTNSLSIEGWIRPQGGTTILWRGDDRPGFDPWALSLDNANNLTFGIQDQGGNPAGVAAPLALGQWYHVAGMLDGTSGRLQLYTNGVLAVQAITAIRPFGALDASLHPEVDIGNVNSHDYFAFEGDIDEISLYSRALSASEAMAIYRAGAAGKFDPAAAAPANLAKARVTLGTGLTNVFHADNNTWKINTLTFTANQNGTSLQVEGLEPGVLLDNVALAELSASASYYQPEESLDALIGDDARGVWTLEAWDNRAGATNVAPIITSWKLDLAFENVLPLAQQLRHKEVLTNTISGSSIHFFFVDVPLWANYATNTLTNATGPLNLVYNANVVPLQGAPGDFPLLTGQSNGVATLFNTSIPPLVVGSRYWLAVENPGAGSVTYSISVEFDITRLTNAVSLVTTQASLRPRYFVFDVSTNAGAVLFETFNANGNVDLVLRRGLPLPDLTSFDYQSTNAGTNRDFIIVSTNSAPVNLTSGSWYAGVFNRDPAPVNYTIRATELATLDPVIIKITPGSNELCITWASVPGFSYYVVGKVNISDPVWVPVSPTIVAVSTNTTYCIALPTPFQFFRVVVGTAPEPPDPDQPIVIPPNSFAYLAVPVPDWPYAATNTLISSSLPVNVWFNQNGLPTGTAFGDVALFANTNRGVFTLMTNTTPRLVTNQTYYLGLHNPNPTPATVLFGVEFNVTRLTNGVVLSDTLLSKIPRYFSLAVPSNAAAAFFQIFGLTTNVDLVVQDATVGIPTLTSNYYASLNPGKANDGIFVTTNSTPHPLTTNTWNISVFNRTAGTAGYTIRATTSTNGNPDIIDTQISGTNLCLTWNSIPGLSYYVAGKVELTDVTWTPVSPTIVATNLTTTYCIPLTTPFRFFQVRIGVAPLPVVPDPDVPVVIGPRDFAYFVVPVSDWPYAVTNALLTATLPVDLIFNQTLLPTGSTPGDAILLAGTNVGVVTLLSNTTPALVTNRSYYLALRNNNPVPVTASLRVEFNTTLLTNGVSVSDTLLSAIPRYFTFAVPTGAYTAAFALTGLSGNADLVLAETGHPTLTAYDYGSFNLGITNELITVTTNSAPRPLSTNDWNLSVFSRTTGNATYTVRANANVTTNTGPVIIDTQITSSNLCLTWTSIPGSNYYVAGKVDLGQTNWTPVSPTITATSNLTTYCVSLTNGNRFFIVVLTNTVTPPPSTPPVIFNTQISATNLCLTWSSIVGSNYYVAGKVELTNANWVEISPVITATSTQTTYCVSLTNSNHFFTVVLTNTVTPPPPSTPPVIFNTQISATNLCLTWSSIVGSNYYVAGKVELTNANWLQISPVITATSTQTTYCVSLTNSNHFFTVVLTNTVTPPPPSTPPMIFNTQISATNLCLTWSSIVGSNYYVAGKVELTNANWVQISPVITATSTQTTYCVSLTNSNHFFTVVLTNTVTPPPPSTPPVILNTQINATNLCLTWSSIVGTNYQVVGKDALTNTTWTPVSSVITAISNVTSYCVSLANSNRFFAVLTAASPPAAPLTFSSIVPGAGGRFTLNWQGPPAARFQVQWSPAIPTTNWSTFTNIIAASATNAGLGSFSFTDSGTQTNGFGVQRFYQLLQLP